MPFLNLTGTVAPKVKEIQSSQEIQEFVMWESNEVLLYRSNNELYSLDLSTGTDGVLTPMKTPLARIVDDNERYILSATANSLYDIQTDSWLSYSTGGFRRPQKLFWKNGQLFLLQKRFNIFVGTYYQVIKLDPNQQQLTLHCNAPTKVGNLNLVEGSVYPNIYWYEISYKAGRQHIQYYEMNAETCTLVRATPISEPIDVNIRVKKVFHFEDQDGYAALLDHPTKSIRWETSQSCRYFTLPQKPMAPSPNHSLLATWTTKGKNRLELYNLATGRKVEVPWTTNFNGLSKSDLWLTKHQKTLYLTPGGTLTRKRLWEVTLDGILP